MFVESIHIHVPGGRGTLHHHRLGVGRGTTVRETDHSFDTSWLPCCAFRLLVEAPHQRFVGDVSKTQLEDIAVCSAA